MGLVSAPRIEGTVQIPDGRELGYAEFGAEEGRTVVWLHGTPGGRRQIPQAARAAAESSGLRIIGVDRPGVGLSTPHLYDSMLGFTHDLEVLLDRRGVDRVAMVGLSGGGPYALATACAFPDRVAAAGILGGVAPTRGEDAVQGGPVSLALRAAPVITLLREPLGAFLTKFAQALHPVASQGFDLYAHFAPEGDKRIFAQPEIKEMFLDDLLNGSKEGLKAPVYDLILFTRDWGFRLESIRVPVHWWHGDADNFVPLEHAHHVTARIPRCELTIRPGESHLGGMGAAEEVLATVVSMWDGAEVATRERR